MRNTLLVWFSLLLVQFSSVAQSCPTLCEPMNCSTPGLPVHHQLPESIQTHVHRVQHTKVQYHSGWAQMDASHTVDGITGEKLKG